MVEKKIFLTNLKHGAVTYSSYIQLKTRGPTGLQHYIDMKKFQCSSQMCVSEYVYPPHVRCIKSFLMLHSHGGLHSKRVPVSRISCPVCLNCFFVAQVPDLIGIWMPFRSEAHALKIIKSCRLTSWEPYENLFIFSYDVLLLLRQNIYLRFFFLVL